MYVHFIPYFHREVLLTMPQSLFWVGEYMSHDTPTQGVATLYNFHDLGPFMAVGILYNFHELEPFTP